MSLLPLYRVATTVAGPAIDLYLNKRLKRGKEDPERLCERKGQCTLPRPDGPLLWLHAASVGEAVSSLSLIERLLATNPALNILQTTGTVTSARLMGERLPQRVQHQFVPVDRPAWRASAKPPSRRSPWSISRWPRSQGVMVAKAHNPAAAPTSIAMGDTSRRIATAGPTSAAVEPARTSPMNDSSDSPATKDHAQWNRRIPGEFMSMKSR